MYGHSLHRCLWRHDLMCQKHLEVFLWTSSVLANLSWLNSQYPIPKTVMQLCTKFGKDFETVICYYIDPVIQLLCVKWGEHQSFSCYVSSGGGGSTNTNWYIDVPMCGNVLHMTSHSLMHNHSFSLIRLKLWLCISEWLVVSQWSTVPECMAWLVSCWRLKE